MDNDSYVLLPHVKNVLLPTTTNPSKVDAKVGIYDIKWERNLVETCKTDVILKKFISPAFGYGNGPDACFHRRRFFQNILLNTFYI